MQHIVTEAELLYVAFSSITSAFSVLLMLNKIKDILLLAKWIIGSFWWSWKWIVLSTKNLVYEVKMQAFYEQNNR